MSFSDFFHQLSKRHESIPADTAEWPSAWVTIDYKTYPQLAHIPLPRAETNDERSLFDTIRTRRSRRDFSGTTLSLEDLSTLLRYACGIQPPMRNADVFDGLTAEQHRAHPSGGGRFPIETYLLNFRAGEIPAGVFHYDIRHHGLDVLEKRTYGEGEIGRLFYYPFIAEGASCAIILTGVFARTQMKYGERGYRYVLLEAGHIAQNISLVSNAIGLKSVMMAGSDDRAIEHLLDIDGQSESLVYTAIVGH